MFFTTQITISNNNNFNVLISCFVLQIVAARSAAVDLSLKTQNVATERNSANEIQNTTIAASNELLETKIIKILTKM